MAKIEEAKKKAEEKRMANMKMDEMHWVQLRQELSRDSDGNLQKEVQFKKRTFMDEFSKNPFIPLGCVATIGFLLTGISNFARNNRRGQQMMMRGRVAAQGFTFTAIDGALVFQLKDKIGKRNAVTTAELPANVTATVAAQ